MAMKTSSSNSENLNGVRLLVSLRIELLFSDVLFGIPLTQGLGASTDRLWRGPGILNPALLQSHGNKAKTHNGIELTKSTYEAKIEVTTNELKHCHLVT